MENQNNKSSIPIVFVCAPYTARTGRGISYNIRLAQSFARQLAHAKIGFICPHTNSAHMHDIDDPIFWYEMYIALLELCDAMLVVGNYHQSSGCRKEIEVAEKLRMPIFYTLPEVIVWHQKQQERH